MFVNLLEFAEHFKNQNSKTIPSMFKLHNKNIFGIFNVNFQQIHCINPFQLNATFHIETSHLIWNCNIFVPNEPFLSPLKTSENLIVF